MASRSLPYIALAVSACVSPFLGGCAAATVGAVAGVGLYAVQDRTIGEGIDDAAASQEIKTRLIAADASAFAEVDVEVAGRAVLLSGAAPTEEHRRAAETIAYGVRSVDRVYNEISIGPRSGIVRSAEDEFITAQVRARLIASSHVRALNVNIETYHGVVYLMGTARSQAELRRAAEIASYVSGVERVVSFMRLLETPTAPPAYAGWNDNNAQTAQAEPAPIGYNAYAATER